jgi:hypothetical protein
MVSPNEQDMTVHRPARLTGSELCAFHRSELYSSCRLELKLSLLILK